MAGYKINVRKGGPWRKKEAAIIGISQGQSCHDGAKLDALLEWTIAHHKFCALNISDTLHRHNLMRQGATPEEALAESYRLGTAWIRRNGTILEKHASGFQALHRWSDWLYHNDFSDISREVRAFYHENPAFQTAVHADIENFMGRKVRDTDMADSESGFVSSLNYLLEEIAAYIIIGRTYKANRIYPAKPLKAFEFLYKGGSIPASIRGMEESLYVHITFRRTGDEPEGQRAA